MRYVAREQTSEGPYRMSGDLIAAGPQHLRYLVRASGFAPMLFVYDGQRLLVHDPEESRPWSLYEAPAEHPEALGPLAEAYADPGSGAFARYCPDALVVGRRSIAGRVAVGYRCAAGGSPNAGANHTHVVWSDEKTHLLLQSGNLHAVSVDVHPTVSADTFATQPPAGAKVAVYRARNHPAGELKSAADFALKRVSSDGGSGTVHLADYAHRPLVLAFFSSDLTFDTSGDGCPRCLHALLTLQRLTGGGSHPAVLAIQNGEEGKPGLPLIPRGLRVAVANDPAADVEHAYGLSEQVGFVFIGSDAKVHQTFDGAPADGQLAAAVHALQ